MEHIFLEYMKQNHRGKRNSASSVYLQNELGVSGRTIRRLVNQLRNNGLPICSDENGYYYATDKSELICCIHQMSSRMKEIAKAKNGLVKALGNFPDEFEQIRFELRELQEER